MLIFIDKNVMRNTYGMNVDSKNIIFAENSLINRMLINLSGGLNE